MALENRDELKSRFDALRMELFGRVDGELHSYAMHGHPGRIAATLKIGIELEMKVAALCIDKTASTRQGVLPEARHFAALAALQIWDELLRIAPISRLTHDTEIEGKERQKRFETALKRQQAAIHPTQTLKSKSLPSHQSDLIQLADVVAYSLSRQIRSEKMEAEVEALLQTICTHVNNTIRGPKVWGD